MTPRTPRFKLGLTLRIILALALVGLGPLLVAFFLLVRIQREGYGDQVLVTHSVAARTAAERTASFLDSLAVVGRTLAGNSALLADPRSPSAQELLRGTLESRPDIALLALLDARGELVVQGARRDLSAEVSALATGSGTDNLAVTRFEGVPWLAWDFPLEGGQGRLRLIASGKGLAESIRGYEMSAEEAALVVIDQDRQLVTGTTESLEEFAPEQLAAAATGKVAGAGEYRDAAGASVLGAFAPVGRQGWYVLSRQPARLAERITQGIRRDSVRSLGLALLLVAALSSLGHLGLVRPLRRLAGAQRELAGVAAAPSGNELEDLRNAFEALEQRVRHHQELDRIFLGRYQVVRLLGHGAMGTVFLGWDPKLERQLALKTVRLGTDLAEARRRELSAKLMQEAVTAARFLHPNIIAVYDFGRSPGGVFY
nr:hypothetical protein [Thermoanaerobaculia bacterium]